MDQSTYIFIALVLTIAIGGWLARRVRTQRRRDAMKALSSRLMFSYAELSDALTTRMQSSYHLGGRGRGHLATNVLMGNQDGLDMTLFDFYFKTGYGRNTRHHRNTAIEIASSRLDLPLFTLRQKGTFDGLSKLFSKEARVELSNSTDAFNNRYAVSVRDGGDTMAIDALFNSDLINFFERAPLLNVEGNRERLLLYRKKGHLKTDDIDQFVHEMGTIFNRLASKSNW